MRRLRRPSIARGASPFLAGRGRAACDRGRRETQRRERAPRPTTRTCARGRGASGEVDCYCKPGGELIPLDAHTQSGSRCVVLHETSVALLDLALHWAPPRRAKDLFLEDALGCGMRGGFTADLHVNHLELLCICENFTRHLRRMEGRGSRKESPEGHPRSPPSGRPHAMSRPLPPEGARSAERTRIARRRRGGRDKAVQDGPRRPAAASSPGPGPRPWHETRKARCVDA